MCPTSAASGKFRQHGRLGGLMTTPVFGSSGPGEQMPTPRIKLCAPAAPAAWAHAASIALVTDASPREGAVIRNHGIARVAYDLPTPVYQARGHLSPANAHSDHRIAT